MLIYTQDLGNTPLKVCHSEESVIKIVIFQLPLVINSKISINFLNVHDDMLAIKGLNIEMNQLYKYCNIFFYQINTDFHGRRSERRIQSAEFPFYNDDNFMDET